MYLEEIYLENTGPIKKCHIEKMPFDENGNPRPVVVVGANGSGKSIFLSYIVDALTEFAKKAFPDIVPVAGQRIPFYRIVAEMAIRSGAAHSLGLLHFRATQSNLYYCEQAGRIDPHAHYATELKSKYADVWKWPPKQNSYKEVTRAEEVLKDEMKKGVHVFFPDSRRENPDWLNLASVSRESDSSLPFRASDDELAKPIHVETSAEDSIRWVSEVVLDAMIEPEELAKMLQRGGREQPYSLEYAARVRQALQTAVQNVQVILSAILQERAAEFMIKLRSVTPYRLLIRLEDGREIPSLTSLSQGQSQLFTLFSTIIRYGEREDINRSIQLSDITGLVVIDEIDAHLHASIQHKILPELISLFPKVQFVVSSHSPLFLLGMEKKFGAEGFWALELPTGRRIATERYSEFVNAFMYYQDTLTFEEQMKKRIKDGEKPLVFTEGKTDVRYIKTALDLLGKAHLLDHIDIEPVGGEGDQGDRNGGKKGLDRVKMCYELHPNILPRPLLLLYDCDVKDRDERADKLWLRSIPMNPENTEVEVGIENRLSRSVYENEDCPYDKIPSKKGGYRMEPDKKGVCQWLCEERREPEDFAGFDVIVQILEEFVIAFQS